MKFEWLKIFIFFLLALVVFDACKKESFQEPTKVPIDEASLRMIWHQSDIETQEQVTTGLLWCFSFLGATLPDMVFEKGIVWESDRIVKINFKKLGFSPRAQKELFKIVKTFKNSNEFQRTSSVDIGRFVVTVFNNSNHYYKIVNVPTNKRDFEKMYKFNPKKAGIVESLVAFGERELRLPKTINISNMGFIANEIKGKLSDANHSINEFEVMDIMENGQQRFAVYNLEGNLISGANSIFSSGGKPAKCLWCHETDIPRAFVSKNSVKGYYTIAQFDSIIALCNTELYRFRKGLSSELDFSKRQDHTELEKLYIRFMEPSLKRIMSEMSVSEDEVRKRLQRFSTHTHAEFPEFGELYFRKSVDSYNPKQNVPVCDEARETGEFEPDYL